MYVRITVADAASAASDALAAVGVVAESGHLVVSSLIEAELRGHPSHGLLRLPRIVERIENGATNPSSSGNHEWDGVALLRVDGERGLGPVVATSALSEVTRRATKTGIAACVIRNCDHLGMLASYVEQVAREGLLAIAATTSEALVHPWGGVEAMIGSNPLAIGVPTTSHPLVLDMATSTVSRGRIQDYANRRLPLEPGWAVNKSGASTTDAEAALDGAISPFGGAKGYGLGIALEAMVGLATGSSFGRAVVGTLDSVRPSTKGDVFIVMRPAPGPGATSLTDFLYDVRQTSPANPGDPVLVPGDRARARRERAVEEGISVPRALWQQILSLTETPTHLRQSAADTKASTDAAR